jgi:hypothetical protein
VLTDVLGWLPLGNVVTEVFFGPISLLNRSFWVYAKVPCIELYHISILMYQFSF